MPSSYLTLNDAAVHSTKLRPGTTEIWYMRPEKFRDLGMGLEFAMQHAPESAPLPLALGRTHIMVGRIAETNKEDVFRIMQGEFWSPNGEARELITSLGLKHTSMSVGDIIVVKKSAHIVQMVGFMKLGKIDDFRNYMS